jgi:hypothetical protein
LKFSGLKSHPQLNLESIVDGIRLLSSNGKVSEGYAFPDVNVCGISIEHFSFCENKKVAENKFYFPRLFKAILLLIRVVR